MYINHFHFICFIKIDNAKVKTNYLIIQILFDIKH